VRMTVIGCGRLGVTHAASMAEIGHEVVGVDIDVSKVDTLATGQAWFHEPELDDLLAKHTVTGRLRFTTDFAEAAGFGEMHFLCVATPGMTDRDDYDLTQVFAAVRSLAPHLDRPATLVGKSTVPVGTTEAVAELVHGLAPAGKQVEVLWNPEFLREGFAVQDTLRPARIVVGVSSAEAEKKICEAYARITGTGVPLLVTDPRTAELVKGAANAFLATRISFINAIADVCAAVDADSAQLVEALGLDTRIGQGFLNPGIGYGGGCLPKDTRAFAVRGRELGLDRTMRLFTVVDEINLDRRARVVETVRQECGPLPGLRIAVWGAAFKANTDDIRDSPALDVANRLRANGALVTVYDPKAMGNAAAAFPDLAFARDAVSAAEGADVVVLATEWPEFRDVSPEAVGAVARQRLLIDARNLLDPAPWKAAGWRLCPLTAGAR
jgi:UDPglucose 6-dehydrogenase